MRSGCVITASGRREGGGPGQREERRWDKGRGSQCCSVASPGTRTCLEPLRPARYGSNAKWLLVAAGDRDEGSSTDPSTPLPLFLDSPRCCGPRPSFQRSQRVPAAWAPSLALPSLAHPFPG